MGVAAFFMWLSRKYPSIVVDCVEEKVITYLSNAAYIVKLIFLKKRGNVKKLILAIRHFIDEFTFNFLNILQFIIYTT